MQATIHKTPLGKYRLSIILNTPFGLNNNYTLYTKILTKKEFKDFNDCIINSSDIKKENYNPHLNGVDVKEIDGVWTIEEKYNQLALMICKSGTNTT